MIDIHAHILPDIDDGAPNLKSALTMAAQAVESGVKHMVMTPHCNLDELFENFNDDDYVRNQMDLFKQQVEAAGIPLLLYTGMEVFGTPEVPSYLKEGRLLTINDTRYLLIEFAFKAPGSYITSILEDIRELDYIPIVAHPERYSCVQEDPGLADFWIDMGCGTQINKGSILGRFGKAPSYCSRYLLEHGMAACIASDAHHYEWRTPHMTEIYHALKKRYGISYTDFLLKVNPERILAGRPLLWPID